MKKNLSSEYQAALTSKQIKTTYNIIVGGSSSPYSSDCIEYSYSYNKQFGVAQCTVNLQNGSKKYSTGGAYELQQGQSVLVRETLVHTSGSDSFDKFFGIIDQISFNEGLEQVTITCLDNIVKLKNTDLNKKYEAGGAQGGTKVAINDIGGIRLKANIVTGNLAQIFDFVDSEWEYVFDPETGIYDDSAWTGNSVEAIATNPAPIIRGVPTAVNPNLEVDIPEFSINHETGQIIFVNPININQIDIKATYSYYEEGMQVEDIIADIIKTEDGYGNALFTDSNIKDTYYNTTGYTTNSLIGNAISVTIDDVVYPAGQVWYFTFDNLTSSTQFDLINDFVLSSGLVASINIKYGAAILAAPIDPTTETITCTKQDYEFYTLQSTYIETPYADFSEREVGNRINALEDLRGILPPNYLIRTRGDNKIWGSYIHQATVKDYDLEMTSELNYVGDKEVYTRCVVFGKSNNPNNLMSGSTLHTFSDYTGYTDQAKLDYFVDYDFTNQYLYLKPSVTATTITNVLYNPEPPRLFAGDFDDTANMVEIGNTASSLQTYSTVERIKEGTTYIGWRYAGALSTGKNKTIELLRSDLTAIPELRLENPADSIHDDYLSESDGYVYYRNKNIASGIYEQISSIRGYFYDDQGFTVTDINSVPTFRIANPSLTTISPLYFNGEPTVNPVVNASYYETYRSSYNTSILKYAARWIDSGTRYQFDWGSDTDAGQNVKGYITIDLNWDGTGAKLLKNYKISTDMTSTAISHMFRGDIKAYRNNVLVYERWFGRDDPTTLFSNYMKSRTISNIVADRIDIELSFYANWSGNIMLNSGRVDIYFPTREVYDITNDYLAKFWYNADINFGGTLSKEYLSDDLEGNQVLMTFPTQPLEDIPLFRIDLGATKEVQAIDFTAGYYKIAGDANNYPIRAVYTLEYSTDTGESVSWTPVSSGSLYFNMSEGQTKSFELNDLNGGITARQFKLTLNSVDKIGNLDLWGFAIDQLAIYENIIIRGEAKLTATESEDSITTDVWTGTSALLYDENSLLGLLGDVLYKETKEQEDLTTKELAQKRAYYILKEYYKNHTNTSVSVVFMPHLDIGDTVAVPKNDVAGGEENYMIEGIQKSGTGLTVLTLGRYPS